MSSPVAENPQETSVPPQLEEHTFEPGKSPNPGGRPKGLAKRVREEIGDEGDLVKIMLTIAYDSAESTKDRMDAVKWLADRGWGKAPAFAPVEDDDPLELGEREANEIALGFDQRLDEIARRRAENAAKDATPA